MGRRIFTGNTPRQGLYIFELRILKDLGRIDIEAFVKEINTLILAVKAQTLQWLALWLLPFQ